MTLTMLLTESQEAGKATEAEAAAFLMRIMQLKRLRRWSGLVVRLGACRKWLMAIVKVQAITERQRGVEGWKQRDSSAKEGMPPLSRQTPLLFLWPKAHKSTKP